MSVSGYSKRRRSQHSLRFSQDQELLRLIKKIHKKFPKYGSPRIWAVLHKRGILISRKRVERVMRENGISGLAKPRPRGGELWYLAAPQDLVQRNFKVKTVDGVWFGDVTEIPTDQGLLQLAAVEDAASKAIVGDALSENVSTDLVLKALHSARRKRNPKKGLIFHSDHGSVYRSHRFESAVASLGWRSSYGAKGTPHDNACIESFFATLQKELLEDHHFHTKAEAKRAVSRFIRLYNTERLHSTLGYQTPREVQLAA